MSPYKGLHGEEGEGGEQGEEGEEGGEEGETYGGAAKGVWTIKEL